MHESYHNYCCAVIWIKLGFWCSLYLVVWHTCFTYGFSSRLVRHFGFCGHYLNCLFELLSIFLIISYSFWLVLFYNLPTIFWFVCYLDIFVYLLKPLHFFWLYLRSITLHFLNLIYCFSYPIALFFVELILYSVPHELKIEFDSNDCFLTPWTL